LVDLEARVKKTKVVRNYFPDPTNFLTQNIFPAQQISPPKNGYDLKISRTHTNVLDLNNFLTQKIAQTQTISLTPKISRIKKISGTQTNFPWTSNFPHPLFLDKPKETKWAGRNQPHGLSSFVV
jgi:hypothetical protein